MKKIFYIAPHYIDDQFDKKIAVLQELAKIYGLEVLTGVKEGITFSSDKTAKIHNKADFFIADLSFERASCYYELGWAVGQNKPVFLIAKQDTPIHQTHDAVRFYTDLDSYKNTLTKILQKTP